MATDFGPTRNIWLSTDTVLVVVADQHSVPWRSFVDEARRQLADFDSEGSTTIVSSSFQTHSLPMLDIVASNRRMPVYFLDTGFHFPETLRFRDDVARRLDLEIVTLRSPVTKLSQSTGDRGFLYTHDPDHCCHINKTAPMELVARSHDVWISGVRRDQSATRSTFETIMPGPGGTRRYHPMLDWTELMIDAYIEHHGLPRHPLDAAGYRSIGCAPCTRRPRAGGADRDERWAGLAKTECGLHLDLVQR